jgi:hypothetical protein
MKATGNTYRVRQYMGRMEKPNMKPQEVKFFKIDEDGHDPVTS